MKKSIEPGIVGEFGAYAASADYTPPKDTLVLQKLKTWQDQKLGLLITWGPYSQWGVVESWSLVTTRFPWNNRPPQFAGLDDRAYVKEYESLPGTFNPMKFDPGKWAAAVKDAGIKYVLPMAKHHDGFCMYDTATTDYRITSSQCPFSSHPKADVTREMCAAFRRQGLSVGLYFSKPDWNSPYYWQPQLPPGIGQGANYKASDYPEAWQKFKEFTWKQIEELMTGYGPQDILWLDGGAVRPPEEDIDMDGIAAMARRHQPGLIVVDRTVKGPNENYVTPEQEIPDHFLQYPWETCMTMGQSWSYRPDALYKSIGVLIRNLCRIVARNGNYLMGVAVGPDGELDEAAYVRFKEMGAWLKVNGEAIYETRPMAPYEEGDCVFTCKSDRTVYVIVLSRDDNDSLPESITVPAELAANSGQVTLLGFGAIPAGQTKNGRTVFDMPAGARANPPCANAWVLRINTAILES